ARHHDGGRFTRAAPAVRCALEARAHGVRARARGRARQLPTAAVHQQCAGGGEQCNGAEWNSHVLPPLGCVRLPDVWAWLRRWGSKATETWRAGPEMLSFRIRSSMSLNSATARCGSCEVLHLLGPTCIFSTPHPTFGIEAEQQPR